MKVKAAGKNCVIASLMADKIESSVLELMFEEVNLFTLFPPCVSKTFS